MQKRVHASWSEPYLTAELTGSTSNVRLAANGDEGGWVESASDVRLLDGRLWIAQDHSACIAVAGFSSERGQPAATAVLHVLYPDLEKRFGRGGIEKAEKPDTESLVRLDAGGKPRLLALSSGSTPARRWAALLDPSKPEAPLAGSGRLEKFFEHLAVRWDIIGTELNLEGAVALPDAIRFLQRGNGARKDERRGHNTAFDIPLADWLAYVESAFADPSAPFSHETIQNIFAYDLGSLEGERLTFSGGDELGAGWSVYAASAEKSPDVYHDGPTVGAAIGLLAADGRAMQAPLRGPDNTLIAAKVEGVAISSRSTDSIELLLAVDPDEAGTPSPFLTAVLKGSLVKKILQEIRGEIEPSKPAKFR